MKKLMNQPADYVLESLEGFVAAHASLVRLNKTPLFVQRNKITAGKVALISGGGSGHEPAHVGFVGHGMLDAACPGEVFTSPVPAQIEAAIRACDSGGGALLIVKNYQGDVMNFEIGAEMAGARVNTVIVNDDVSGDDPAYARGMAGVLVVEKILGAAAEAGESLSLLKLLGDRLVRRMATMALMLEPCTLPLAGVPTFELAGDEVEFGVGIHGERGHAITTMTSVNQLVARLMAPILVKLAPFKNPQVLLLVNGMGATPEPELYQVYREADIVCRQQGIEVVRSLVGNYVTSIDAAGCSITLVAMDEELLTYWDAGVCTPALFWSEAP